MPMAIAHSGVVALSTPAMLESMLRSLSANSVNGTTLPNSATISMWPHSRASRVIRCLLA